MLRSLKLGISIFYIAVSFTAYAQQVRKLRIDPKQAYGGHVSEYCEDVEYIPLETTKESLFGNINSLIITDTSFIIYDFDTHSVLFFNSKTGKFLSKIKGSNSSYYSIYNDKAHCKVVVYEDNSQTKERFISFYSYLGSPIGKRQKEILKKEIWYLRLGDHHFYSIESCSLHAKNTANTETGYLIHVYDSNKVERHSYLPYDKTKDMAFCDLVGYVELTEIPDEDSYLVCMPLDYTLYRFNKDSIEALFQFVFPQDRTLSRAILGSQDKGKLDDVRARLFSNTDIILSVSNVHLNNEMVYFKINPKVYISNAGSEDKNQYNLIYGLKSGKLISLEHIIADSTSSFLPILGNMSRINGLYSGAGYLYNGISSLTMFDAYKKNKSRSPAYSSVLKSYFATQSIKSNPVIIKMKMKEF